MRSGGMAAFDPKKDVDLAGLAGALVANAPR